MSWSSILARWMARYLSLAGFFLLSLAGASLTVRAHTLNMTRVSVTFDTNGVVMAKVDVDLGLLIGSMDGYADLIRQTGSAQQSAIQALSARVLEEIHFRIDDTSLPLTLKEWHLPAVPPEKLGTSPSRR